MTRIALLHYSCPPVVGGVEEIVRQQASLFYRHYHPVKVLAGFGGRFTQDFPIEINPLFGSRNSSIQTLQQNPKENWESLQKVTRQILDALKTSLSHYDVLIAHNVLSMHYNLPLTMALHQLADEKEIKVVAWNHDSPYFYRNVAQHLFQEPWSILRRLNPNITYITISESRKQEFGELYGQGDSIVVVPNGIDPIRFFRLDANTVRVIQEQNLFDQELILVQPSRLHPRKNIELSIKVIRAIHDRGVEAVLLLTGAYDPHERKTVYYYNRLQQLAKNLGISEHIIILAEYKFQTGEKLSQDRVIMRDLYHISDVLFLPSKMEGFGIPLLEAGMIKLPIACSNIPPFTSIANKDVLYFSLDDSPDAIADKLLAFLEELKPHRMFRAVIRNYVWDNLYQRQLLPLLQKVMGSPSP